MSTTIDERVVEMRFDNKQFESNVQTSLSTLDRLKNSLNLSGATKGLEAVDAAAKKVDMSGLGMAVESVKMKFSALEVMAVTALANITNSAVNTGKQLVCLLTIDPIKMGFQEYETQINAVQTILANTSKQGTNLEQINAALDMLNLYADKTIYNFAEMTRNIGTFTAAGVDLETSVGAIKGIANLAAISGSTSQQASMAMYQLSQALAAGKVSLQDWNSVVNAGMGGKIFQDALKDTAEAMGIVVDRSISFRESISSAGGKESWLTSEVLLNTLNQFTGDLTDAELAAMGFTEAQIANIQEMAKIANSAATEVKTFTQLYDTLKEAAQSGWTQSWEIVIGDFEEAKKLLTEISNVFGDMINSSAETRNAILQGWKDLGGRTELIEAMRNAFEEIMSIIKPIQEAFREIFPPITAQQLYDFTESLRKLTERMILSETTSENLKSTFKGLFAVLDIIHQAVMAVFNAIGSLFGGVGNLGANVLGVMGFFGDWLVKLNEFIKQGDVFNKVLGTIVNVIKTVASPGFELFHSLLERVQARMSQIGDVANGMKSSVSSIFEAMENAFANCQLVQLFQAIWNAVKSITGGIVDAMGKVGSSLIDSIGNADFSGVIDLLNGISFGAIAVGITKFVNGFRKAIEEVGSIKKSFVGILDSVRGCFEAYQSQLQAGTLLKIASAIAILTASLVALSLIDSNKLAASLGAITVLFADLMASMTIFNGLSGKVIGVIKSTTAMLAISVVVLILASALKKLGDLDAKQLAVGLTGVIGLTATVIAVAKIIGSSGPTIIKGAAQMVIFAAAIKVLVSACIDLSIFDWNQLARGLTSIAIALAEVAAFTYLTGNAQYVISTSVALMGIGAAIKIFALAVKDFSGMQWRELVIGLTGMAGALAAVRLAVNFMPENMIAIGTGLIAISGALLIMASVLDNMGDMEWNEITKGLVALGGSLGIMAAGLRTMTGTLPGSAAMLLAASAIAILTPVLSILGAMSWTAIAKGLVSLAGAFTVIGVAGVVLTPLIPTILGLSGAFALISVAILGVGAGLLVAGTGLSALAVGFTALAAAGTAGATAIVASLTVIITGLAELIPAIVTKIGKAIIELCKVIASSAGEIGKAVKEVVLMIVDVLVECVPQIVDGALKLIAGVLEALVQYTPQIIDSIFRFLIGLLEGVAQNLPGLIQAAVDVLMAFFSGIVDALKGIDTETLLQGIVGIGLLAGIMAALSAVTVLVPDAMVGVLGMGLVIAELALVLAAIGGLAQISGLEWLINEGGNLLQEIGTAISKFIGGIVSGFMSGVSSQFPQIATDLSGFMTNIQPFIRGTSAINPSMMYGVKALAEIILILTAANILKGLTSWLTGGSSLTRFAEELVPFGKAMKQFADEIAGIDGEVISNAAIAGKTFAEMAATIPNSGGIVSWFTGDNDIASFGEKLVLFGRAMKKFSLAVSGLNADVITNSVTAGKALMELANTVPNSGGLVAFFAGEDDLDMFVEQLVPFGHAMKQYSLAVTGLDTNVVANSANAAKALAELSNNLPNSGGIVSWFTGDNDIASFGEKLVSFGGSFAAYYASVSTVDTAKLNGVVTQFRNLVGLANSITSVDTSGMSHFARDLTNLGNAGIDGFINAFSNATSRVNVAAISMMTTFINSANSQKLTAISTFTAIVKNIVSSLTSQQYQFTTIGSTMMTNFITGVRGKDTIACSIFVQIISGCLSAIRNKYKDFYIAGKYLVGGFADGITANTYLAEARARAMVRAATRAAEEELDEHSPSRVGYRIGDFFGLGFVNALLAYADKSCKAGASMASAAKNGLDNAVSKIREFVDGEMDVQPTIRPVLDLSEVRSEASRLTAILSRNQAMRISSSMNRDMVGEVPNGDIVPALGNSYSFVQNNYSPKALSRIDIYRQTKNQFSVLKGLVEI